MQPHEDESAPRNVGGYPGAILLVEDEILTRFALSSELQAGGLTVFEAGNATEALEILENGAAIAVVFTDVYMPGPLNGLALARIQDKFPRTICIVTSGHLTSEAVPPDCSFVSKPYDVQDLIRLLTRLARNAAH